MASGADMFSECFQLGRAIRCGDSDAFCKAYDELTICDPKQLETAKELIRQISDLKTNDFDALEEAAKCQSQKWPELSKTFTTSTETIQRYLKKVLRQLTKAADSTSDSGVHSGSEIDSVCGGEEKTRGDKEKDKHDCVQPPILSTIFQSAAERGVTGEETMLIRGLHMYSNGEILKAKEEEEESDDEQCADEKVSTEIHYPAVSSHPACNFNYYEAVNFLWNEWCLASSDHTTTIVSAVH